MTLNAFSNNRMILIYCFGDKSNFYLKFFVFRFIFLYGLSEEQKFACFFIWNNYFFCF